MSIQQAMMMHRTVTGGGGGGDSASLPNPINSFGTSNEVDITMNPNFLGDGLNYISFGYLGNRTDHIWRTGSNPASAYEIQYNETSVGLSGTGVTGSFVNTWISLSSSDTPSWLLTNGIGQASGGRLIIRNASNPGVELANSLVSLTSDPST